MAKKGRKGPIIAGIILAYVALMILPYAFHPPIGAETVASFDLTNFISNTPSGERADILYTNTEALEARLRLINSAEERIIISSFFFHAQESGREVIAALAAAADRGVDIRILVDAISPNMPYEYKYFAALGARDNVEIRIYGPVNIFRPGKIMARMHDKYLITDDDFYILGGRNIDNLYLGDYPGKKNRDWDVLVYTGDVGNPGESSLEDIVSYFEGVWEMRDVIPAYERDLFFTRGIREKADRELAGIYADAIKENNSLLEGYDLEKTVPVNKICFLSNPTHAGNKEPVLFYRMLTFMKEAPGDVYIHTPYVALSRDMKDMLFSLAGSDKNVIMLTNSVENNANIFGAAFYRLQRGSVLKSGIDILEYGEGTSYHGKCFTVGDRITGVGAFNMDMRSAYLDTETMLVIDSEELNAEMREYMESYENVSARVREGEEAYLSPFRNVVTAILMPFVFLFQYLI